MALSPASAALYGSALGSLDEALTSLVQAERTLEEAATNQAQNEMRATILLSPNVREVVQLSIKVQVAATIIRAGMIAANRELKVR